MPPGAPGAIRILIINLMPLKEATERQLCRMLGHTEFSGRSPRPAILFHHLVLSSHYHLPHAVDITFCVPDAADSKNTDPKHLAAFYSKFSAVKPQRFDGVLVTGAPVHAA